MNYNIEKTTESDLPQIMEIIEAARKSIKALGIPQWQNGYPNEKAIRADIENGSGYVLRIDGMVMGTFALVYHEPDYDEIYEGEWKNRDEENYTALHRVALHTDMRGTGISGEIINYIKRHAEEKGSLSVRCDTHPGNLPMRKMLEKNGFIYCGIIHLGRALRNNDPDYKRVAYELML